MMVIFERLDGTRHEMKGIIPLSVRIGSITPHHLSETVSGAHGSLDLGTVYQDRIITCRFGIVANDVPDYDLIVNETFRLFDSRQPFYLIQESQPGKRYKVKTAQTFTPQKVSKTLGEFELDFISSGSPFAESVGTTLDPITFQSAKWQAGQGLITDENYGPIKYTHKEGPLFHIYNAGDVTIDPRQHQLLITFKGKSYNLNIDNMTTGDKFIYYGSTTTKSNLTIDRVVTQYGSFNVFEDTNHKLISLAPGWNVFSITGTEGDFEIKFDFRFLYL